MHTSIFQIRKLKSKIYHCGGKEWGVWGTPTDILHIVDAWHAKANNPEHIKWARDCKAKGDSTPRHFYFSIDIPVWGV